VSGSDDLIKAGDLDGARAALIEAVKADPANARSRLALAEVLLVIGDIDRADTHLDAAQNLDTGFALSVSLTRQLIRAAKWRDETLVAGRLPDLVTPRVAAIDAGLAAILAARGGDAVTVPLGDQTIVDEVSVSGTIDERPFAGWYDGDDRTAGVLEVLTSTGKYLWVPFGAVRGLRWLPVERLRDTVWQPAELDVAEGPSGVVYLPMIYHAAASEMTSDHRLGRTTDWLDGPPARGLGRRTWLIGDDAVTSSDFAALTVAA